MSRLSSSAMILSSLPPALCLAFSCRAGVRLASQACVSPLLIAHTLDWKADSGLAYPAKIQDERGTMWCRCWMTKVVVVLAAIMTATLTGTTVFAFVHAIIFNAPLMRVRVEPLAVAPLAIAMAVTAFASTAGAA